MALSERGGGNALEEKGCKQKTVKISTSLSYPEHLVRKHEGLQVFLFLKKKMMAERDIHTQEGTQALDNLKRVSVSKQLVTFRNH